VLDFGISKTVALNSPGKVEDLTASGLLMGSPGYMSPEQVRSAKAVDTRSDIWSLGVILYEFLAGDAPFTGETLGETFARILSEPPPPISQRRPDVPDGLVTVILRCLERDVERRTQTVGQLATQLAPFAPKSAGPSIERIARICATGGPGGAGNADSPSNTMTAGLGSESSGAESARRDRFIETGPAWLRSGSIPPRRRAAWRVAAVAASSVIVIAVLAISLGIYSLRQPSGPAPAQSLVSASATPPAATVKSVEEPAILTPAPIAQTEPDNVVAAPDAGRLLPQRSNSQQAPVRSETRRASPGHPPAAASADPSLENLLEQRR
jgi:serine/threonine-protein kinase